MLPSTDFDEKEILPGADGTDKAVTTQDDSRALIDAAIAVAEYEKTLSFSRIFKLYWKGAVWSIVLSLALVMEGMDTGLINNFFGQSSFINHFGFTDASGKKYIPADWQAAINNANNIGSIIGLAINGWAQSRFGSRRVYMVTMVLMTGFIFVLVFATSLQMLFAGALLCGIPWGILQTLTTAYAAEICPPAMRGYLAAWVAMSWGAGTFLATGILRGSLSLTGDWGWRVPYMLQWVWPVPLFVAAFFAPESPWYLVRMGKIDQAETTLRRCARAGHYTEDTMRQQIALMVYTNEVEKEESAHATSYRDLFKGNNRRRTEIACVTWLIQMTNGQAICGYATVFLQAAGMPQVQAFNYSMGIQSGNILGTGVAIYLMRFFGRRTFYLAGQGGIGFFMLIVGILGVIPATSGVSIGIAALLVCINLTYKLTLGPACYAIVSEVPSGRIRAQTVVLARASYICMSLVINQLVPRMLNATSWNWGAKCGFFFLGLNILTLVYTVFRIPETRNRTYAELDLLFAEKVPARKFASATVDGKSAALGR
ncbi:hypothetical protein JCM24511_03641 [Saitozyma sp. JCM 24511]|nr:hypothetical protein JCM24511_03641 [Saitozyma sp. JCM 24511]